MRAGFTPGPWYASAPYAGFGSIKQVETDALIFGIAAGGPEEKQSDATCQANANLIAASPDLFEAAVAALELISTSRAEGKGPTNAEALLKLAVSKANGEQVHSDPLPKQVGR